MRYYPASVYTISLKYIDGTFLILEFSTPVIVPRNCSAVMRYRNVWTIGIHIAEGLEFLHFHGHVHRDLKPRNGISEYKI